MESTTGGTRQRRTGQPWPPRPGWGRPPPTPQERSFAAEAV